MTRALSSIAAVSLVLAQPLLMACQCRGCTGGCASSNAAVTAEKSCCNEGEPIGRSCCGLPAGQCPCGSCNEEGASDDGAPDGAPDDGQSCACSAQPSPTAIRAAAVEVDYSVGVQHFLADESLFDAGASRLSECLGARRDDAPGRYGGLRVHAYLGVWLI